MTKKASGSTAKTATWVATWAKSPLANKLQIGNTMMLLASQRPAEEHAAMMERFTDFMIARQTYSRTMSGDEMALAFVAFVPVDVNNGHTPPWGNTVAPVTDDNDHERYANDVIGAMRAALLELKRAATASTG